MQITTTPSNYTAVTLVGGFARVCGKCAGSGIYWRQVLTPNGYQPVEDSCFPCAGSGYVGKVYSTVAAFDKALDRAEKARQRREAKRQEEINAGREAREIAQAEEAANAVIAQQDLASWKYLEARIGDKVSVRGTIVTAVSIDTDFGTSRLIVIETENRESVKLFTSAGWSFEVSRDEDITVEGTVKGFSEYEGQAQTVLNRPKKIN
jgi:hypothetical protein